MERVVRCLLFFRWEYWRQGILFVDDEGTAVAVWMAFLLLSVGCLHVQIALIISASMTLLRVVACILLMIEQGGNKTNRSLWATLWSAAFTG